MHEQFDQQEQDILPCFVKLKLVCCPLKENRSKENKQTKRCLLKQRKQCTNGELQT